MAWLILPNRHLVSVFHLLRSLGKCCRQAFITSVPAIALRHMREPFQIQVKSDGSRQPLTRDGFLQFALEQAIAHTQWQNLYGQHFNAKVTFHLRQIKATDVWKELGDLRTKAQTSVLRCSTQAIGDGCNYKNAPTVRRPWLRLCESEPCIQTHPNRYAK